MRYQTELSKAILTSEKGQELAGYVSQIYGNSYVALWIFQVVGICLGEIQAISDEMRYETNPATADLLLSYWEDHYGIPKDSSLTKEQRRLRIISKAQTRGPCNPTVIQNAVSAAIGGIPVDIVENVAKNTFLVNIGEYIDDITPVVEVLERIKPAHLIYQIRVATRTITETELKVAIALTHAEMYRVEVYS